ncbi:MAG: copper amine oxidase N-terminal domain-containing protein, partial [Syntrophomonas sp.]
FRLPMGSFWTKANIDTDESTAMEALQSSAEWETATLIDSSTMRYGTDYNFILVPASYAGNNNGLFNNGNPSLEVSSYSKGEITVKVTGTPDTSQECYLMLYSNRVYIAEGITGDIAIDIDSPNNKALGTSISGGATPPIPQPEENTEPPKTIDNNKSNEAGNTNNNNINDLKPQISIELQIGQKVISINGSQKDMQIAPFISRGRAYIPVRVLAEAMGIKDDEIKWYKDAGQITLKQDDTTVGINLLNNTITKNGQLAYMMDTPIEVIQPGYTMVPVRYIVEALGAGVTWNGTSNSLIITK